MAKDKEINYEKPKDIRKDPLCVTCGQPEEGHPKDVPGFHNFDPPKPGPAAEGDPLYKGDAKTDDPGETPPTQT